MDKEAKEALYLKALELYQKTYPDVRIGDAALGGFPLYRRIMDLADWLSGQDEEEETDDAD